jgi:predicted ATPase/DNA-binding XRE family transcriptional regulator
VSSSEPRPFGSLLRRYRRDAGLTQEELAERAGLSARTISDLERGLKSTPQTGTLELLAQALELAPGDYSMFLNAVPRRRHQAPTESSLPGLAAFPAEATPLVGREKDEAAAGHLLQARGIRMLTLVGPGGVGKTRLAIRLAQTVSGSYDAGACFVPLASVTGPDLVANAISRALGVRDTGTTAAEALANWLQARRILLVLDNFEHLAAAAPMVSELLSRCPLLTVLATSRVPLRLRAEQLFDVPPLRMPPPGSGAGAQDAAQYSAIALFVQRTRAVRPEFELTDDLVPVVTQICNRLDSLPLAIELAAAQARHMSLETLRDRLDAGASALPEGPVDAPVRQQTMHNTIAWSYDLLQPLEQETFRALSVFVGGFSPEAALEIAGRAERDVAASLELLIGSSLLSLRNGFEGEARYGMLETVRDHSRELASLVGETGDLQERHSAYFRRVASHADAMLREHGLSRLSARLLPDHENLLAALSRLSEQNRLEQALQLAGELVEYWIPWGYVREGRAFIDDLLDRAFLEPTVDVPPLAFVGAARLCWIQNDYERAVALYEQGISGYRRKNDVRGEAVTLNNLGAVAHMQNEYDRAADLYRRAIDLGRIGGNSTRAVAMATSNLGLIAVHRGEDTLAEELLAEAVDLWRVAGDEQLLAVTLGNLGSLHCRCGRYDLAVAVQEEALAMKRKAGDTLAVAKSLGDIALAEAGRGNDSRAQVLLRDALPVFHDSGQKDAVAEALEAIAGIARRSGDLEQAARLYGGAAALRTETGAAHREVDRVGYQAALDELTVQMSPMALESAWRAGQRMTIPELIRDAGVQTGSHVQA